MQHYLECKEDIVAVSSFTAITGRVRRVSVDSDKTCHRSQTLEVLDVHTA